MKADLPVIADLRRAVIPWGGKPISRPGIYSGVPIEVYHGQEICDGPSVSHSVLWKCDSKSPRHAWREWSGNPNRKERDEAAHFTLGRAIHHLAGGEAQFGQHFIVRPAKWDSWRTKDAKEWRALRIAEGFSVLTPEDIETIKGVADSLNEHPTIQAGILKGLVEMTVVYRDPITGLWVKSRPDMLPLDSGIIGDLKTTAEATRIKCQKAIGEFGYHGQLAIADEALWQTVGFEASDHVLVFVEKTDPWCINIKPLEAAAIEWGRAYARRALDTFARCLEAHLAGQPQAIAWTGYDDDEKDAALPDWLGKRYAYEAEHGLLPKVRTRQPRALPAPEIVARLTANADQDEVIL